MQDEIATLQELLKASTPDTTAYETIKAELDAIAEKA
jgi:hypothetical protein